MASIGIIGDGPGGLSAALFLAKAGHAVTVFGTDATVMHYAYLQNYLGLDAMTGSDFQERARAQVRSFGAQIVAEEVTAVASADGQFAITTAASSSAVDYLVLSEGTNAPLAKSLGLEMDDDRVMVDRNGAASQRGVYVVGRSVRPSRSQAIISAGDGAAAALDILSQLAGNDVQDWDSPPKGD